MKNEILNDLYNVGKTKVIGYLPLKTIYKNKKSIKFFKKYAVDNDLKYEYIKNIYRFEIKEENCFYLYSEKKLQNLINKNKTNLKYLPTTAKEFIFFISNNTILYGEKKYKNNTEIRKYYPYINDNDRIFIGLCFGNKI